VKVTTGSSPFCIDTTEATNAQYAQFVASGFTIARAGPPAGTCDDVPGTALAVPPPSGEDDYPVVNVNWCQAYAFCKWAGKRLCGAIAGGALPNASFSDPTQSQWLNACTAGRPLTRAPGEPPTSGYPYGPTFEPTTCGGQAADSTLQSVFYYPSCLGGSPGIHQMSGNAWEWTDSCGDQTPADTAFCDTMGGGFDSTQAELECVGERPWIRNAGAANIGIRCCLDL
jgi:formylglycine-generating enzyme required for sulfatase activity